ncbi:MAG: serine/threonine-protein kinase [Nannocystaceae bacterium]
MDEPLPSTVARPRDCPGEPALVAMIGGSLDPAKRAAIVDHLDVCEPCRRRAGALARASEGAPPRADDPTLADDDGPSEARPLSAGAQLGRYVILRVLGAGGMGIVHAAYDPELDRTVALKLLRPPASSDALSELRARLRREARALARLAHPNVVGVFEVGEAQGAEFVVMEYVDGGSLSTWLLRQEYARPWREVLRVLLDAGRGLAAAHRAGVIHRDIKPGNILVGADGRARVGDFGLARASPPPSTIAAIAPLDSQTALTRTGDAPGTPRYMAPEQLRGAPADARSDQFSFCVTAYEALYGQRPFAGDSLAALTAAVHSGAPRPPPGSARIPARVHAVIARGLAVEPARRYPSMDALLEALARARGGRRSWALALASVALASAGFVGARLLGAAAPCPPPVERLAGVWDDERRAAVQSAFASSGLSYTRDIFTRTAARLDDAAAEWIAAHVAACEATAVRGEQSPALLDLRMRCLDRRLTELRALTDTLADSPRAESITRALQVIERFQSTDACSDLEALADRVPPPMDRDRRAHAEALTDALARARARYELAPSAAQVAPAEALVREARVIDHAPLIAEALELRGDIEHDLGQLAAAEASYREGLEAAAAGRDDDRAAALLIDLLWNIGEGQGRVDEAFSLLSAARAGVVRAGEPTVAQIDLLRTEARLHEGRGSFSEAVARHEAAVELARARLGDASPRLIGLESNLAAALVERGRTDDAITLLEAALPRARETFGDVHPTVADVINNLAMAHNAAGRRTEALRGYQEAAALFTVTLGDHFKTAGAFNNVGTAAIREDRNDEARAALERALAIIERIAGDAHPWAASVLANLAIVDDREGAYATAIARYERAIAIRLAVNKDDPTIALYTGNLGDAHFENGDIALARARYDEALELAEAGYGPDHPYFAAANTDLGAVANLRGDHDAAEAFCARALTIYEDRNAPPGDGAPALCCLGAAHLGRGAFALALALLERAVAASDDESGNELTRALSRKLLAQALRDAGREPARAAALAEEAQRRYARHGRPRERAEAEAWLLEHVSTTGEEAAEARADVEPPKP